MSATIPPEGDDEIRYVESSGRIADPKEITARQEAKSKREQEQHNKLLLELESKQTAAQSIQAQSNRRIVFLTGALAIISVISAVISYLQFKTAKESADAAKSAAETAAKTLDLSERPWIIINRLVVKGPLTIRSDGKASMGVDVVSENIGHTPSKHTMLQLALGTGSDDDIKTIDALCLRGSSAPHELGQIIPGKPTGGSLFYSAEADLNLDRPALNPPLASNEFVVPRAIIGCITYKAFTSEQAYYTGFSYINLPVPENEIARVAFDRKTGTGVSNHGNFSGIGKIEVPQEAIRLYPYPFGDKLPMK